MCLLLQLYFGSSCISDWVTLSKVAALLQMSQKSLEPLIPDVISLALDDCLINRQHFRVVFCPAAIHLKAVFFVVCRTVHHKSLTVACQTQLEKCGAVTTCSVK